MMVVDGGGRGRWSGRYLCGDVWWVGWGRVGGWVG